jgi:hypothetical protein
MKKTPATLFNDNERFFDFYKNKQNILTANIYIYTRYRIYIY